MNTLKKLLLATTVICIAVTPALAKRHGGDGFMGHKGQGGMKMEMLKIALDLTEQQETEIQQIIDEQRKSTEPLREQVHANREAIRVVMDQDTLNEGQLHALMQEQSKLHTEMMVGKHATKTKIDQVLTPEQQQKHDELREARKERRGHKRLARNQQTQQ
jgi:Spy/CpxP family protein refolding chaperone